MRFFFYLLPCIQNRGYREMFISLSAAVVKTGYLHIRMTGTGSLFATAIRAVRMVETELRGETVFRRFGFLNKLKARFIEQAFKFSKNSSN